MVQDTVAHLFRQIQTSSVLLQKLHCPDALDAVPESIRTDPVQDTFSRVAERSVSQVMPQGNGFRQVFVQTEGL